MRLPEPLSSETANVGEATQTSIRSPSPSEVIVPGPPGPGVNYKEPLQYLVGLETKWRATFGSSAKLTKAWRNICGRHQSSPLRARERNIKSSQCFACRVTRASLAIPVKKMASEAGGTSASCATTTISALPATRWVTPSREYRPHGFGVRC